MPKRLTPNQVIAYNLRRARGLHGWTQAAAAERLEPYLGERWSRVVYSVAERSIAGKRIRRFSADEIVAFAAAFELPVAFFFEPPKGVEIGPEKATRPLSSEELGELATGDVATRVGELREAYWRQIEAMGGRVIFEGEQKGGERK